VNQKEAGDLDWSFDAKKKFAGNLSTKTKELEQPLLSKLSYSSSLLS
jgi:hypothetical protein